MFMAKSNYGIEIDFNGISCKDAAEIVALWFSTAPTYSRKTWRIKDFKGRIWKIVDTTPADPMSVEACKLVTPILSGDSGLSHVQEIAKLLNRAYANVDRTCNMYIRVSQKPKLMTASFLYKLAIQWANYEPAVIKGVRPNYNRLYTYCRETDHHFISELAKSSQDKVTIEDIENMWYDGPVYINKPLKYHDSRYHALNLHAFFNASFSKKKKSVEFRLFDSTLNPEKIKAYVQYVCAVVNYAINSEKATYNVVPARKKNFADWLTKIGLTGDKYSVCRTYMMKGYASKA